MKSRIQDLSKQAMELIACFAQQNDPATITKLATSATKLRQMETQLEEIEQETDRIADFIAELESRKDKPSPKEFPHVTYEAETSSTRKKIRIEIAWSRIGKTLPNETICEYKASDSIARWAARLFEVMGVDVIQKLSEFRINRGYMVSKSPERDYMNPSDGKPYQHQPIAKTGYFILTHSQTSQKVKDILNASRFLGLPGGMFKVEEVDKYESEYV